MPTPEPLSSPVCSKCATFQNSGKRSCCARGGTWFKDCGNRGDPNSSHTWIEGIRACNELESASSGEAVVHSMLHHEKASVRTANTTHQRLFSRSQNISQQVTAFPFRREITIDRTLNVTQQQQNIYHTQMDTYNCTSGGECDTGARDAKGCNKLNTVATYSSFLCIIFHLEIY